MIIYDSRGCGYSDNSFITFGYKEKYDLLYLIFYFQLKYNISDFIWWGRSMGANTIIYLLNLLLKKYLKNKKDNYMSTKELKTSKYDFYFKKKIEEEIKKPNDSFLIKSHERFLQLNNLSFNKNEVNFIIHKIVLDSPYSSFKSLFKDYFIKDSLFLNILNKKIFEYVEDYFFKKTKIEMLNWRKVKNKMKNISIPMIFICSQNDEKIKYKRFEKLYNNYNYKYKIKYEIKEKHNEKRKETNLYQIFEILYNLKSSSINFNETLKNENFPIFKNPKKNIFKKKNNKSHSIVKNKFNVNKILNKNFDAKNFVDIEIKAIPKPKGLNFKFNSRFDYIIKN